MKLSDLLKRNRVAEENDDDEDDDERTGAGSSTDPDGVKFRGTSAKNAFDPFRRNRRGGMQMDGTPSFAAGSDRQRRGGMQIDSGALGAAAFHRPRRPGMFSPMGPGPTGMVPFAGLDQFQTLQDRGFERDESGIGDDDDDASLDDESFGFVEEPDIGQLLQAPAGQPRSRRGRVGQGGPGGRSPPKSSGSRPASPQPLLEK